MSLEQNKVQAEIMQAYREIFLHTPQGQIILKDLLKSSGLYAMTGVRSNEELQHMEGARDMVRRVITILALDEEQITQMIIGDVTDVE
tara:strand:- start:267 stop:530 length:264 start_codon:yes stop_codon:yes gene_type:complete